MVLLVSADMFEALCFGHVKRQRSDVKYVLKSVCTAYGGWEGEEGRGMEKEGEREEKREGEKEEERFSLGTCLQWSTPTQSSNLISIAL